MEHQPPDAEELRRVVLDVLRRIVPEADASALPPDVDLRDALEIDSMDLLNFAIGLHERLGVDIPEADYRHLATLNGCVAYLRERLPR